MVATGNYGFYTRCLHLWTEVLGKFFCFRFAFFFTLCNNNKMKEILPQTRHTIHLCGDKHDHFVNLIYLFLNTMSALEINHVFTHDALYYKWRKIILSA